MFTRVRASLLLWNLLIIGVILLAAGTVTYVSQRQSSLANVDRLLVQSAGTLPSPIVPHSQSQPWFDQPAPVTFVVDHNGHVLSDPENLGVKEIALPKASGVTIAGRFTILSNQQTQAEPVQKAQKLAYFLEKATGGIQERFVAISVQPGQNTNYFQLIANARIQGWPVRLLVRPAVYRRVATSAAPAPTGGDVQGSALISAADAQPNAYVVTAVSLAPMEQSLHQTLIFLLIGGAAGVLLSLLGSWFLVGRALIPIQAAFRQQQEFVADAAHELRTPLTVLQTSTHLLNQHRSEPIEAQGTVFDDLHEEIGRLTRLTCDLLDLARFDLSQLDLALGRVDLGELGRTMVRRLSAVAAQCEIELRFEGSAKSPSVDADSDRLQQALMALLDNALKHTPPGGTVTLAVFESGRSAVVEVRDTGEGIPPEVLSRVFDRFYRGDPARSRSTGGSGLGLAIARTLVEAHGGTLTLSSVVGTGTTATIRLPLLAEAPAPGRWRRARRRFLPIDRLF